MAEKTSGAEYYRLRAAEVRATAELVKDPEARQSLLNLAAEYERLAEHIDPKPWR